MPITSRSTRWPAARGRTLSPFTSTFRGCTYLSTYLPMPSVVYIPVDLRPGERASERAGQNFISREAHSVSSGSRPSPATFPANLKDVRHLDGSHAPSPDAVKVDLRGCRCRHDYGRDRKCYHIVSTLRELRATCHGLCFGRISPPRPEATPAVVAVRVATCTGNILSWPLPPDALLLSVITGEDERRGIRLHELRRRHGCI